MFHGGTKKDKDRFLTWGGRALIAVALGADLDAALKRVYDAIGAVSFDGMTYRKDIGYRAVKKPVTR